MVPPKMPTQQRPTQPPIKYPVRRQPSYPVDPNVTRAMQWDVEKARFGWRPYGQYGQPVQQNQGGKYWDNPQRVARYYHAANTLPAGAPDPAWLNRQQLTNAYETLRKANGNEPWYNWKPLAENDPAIQILRSLPMPSPDAMPEVERDQFYPSWSQVNPALKPQKRERYYTMPYEDAIANLGQDVIAAFPVQGGNVLIPTSFIDSYTSQAQQQQPLTTPIEQPTNALGIPQDQYNALPGWQRAVIAGSPWLNTAIGALGGAVTGGFIFGLPGAVAGGIAGGALMKSAESSEAAMKVLTALGKPAMWLEQGVGVLGQVGNSISDPEKYGEVQDVLNNLGAAWEAGQLAYETSFQDIRNKETGEYEVHAQQLGQPAPTIWKAPDEKTAQGWALTEARERILANPEDKDQIIAEIAGKFGIGGTARDLVGQILLDPLNLFGDAANAAGFKFARMFGNKTLADAFQLHSQFAIAGENFQRGLRGEKLLKAGPMYANDVMDAVRAYGTKIRQMPVEDALRFGGVSRWIAGIDSAGSIKALAQGNKWNALDTFRGLTPQARAGEVLHQAVDGLQTMIADEVDPMLAVAKVKAIAGLNPEDVVRSLEDTGYKLPRWFQSGEAQPIALALKDLVNPVDELAARWKITRRQAEVLQLVADIRGQPVARLMADLQSATPQQAQDMFRAYLQETQALTDNTLKAKAQRVLQLLAEDGEDPTGLTFKKFTDTFLGRDHAPFTAEEFRGQLFHLLTDGIERWSVKYFGVKPPNWAVRTGQMIKRAQGLALLGWNPAFMINNMLNNLVTLGWDGLLSATSMRGRMKFLREAGIWASKSGGQREGEMLFKRWRISRAGLIGI